MNTDPHAIRVRVDAVLAELPRIEPGNADGVDGVDGVDTVDSTDTPDGTSTIDAVGRRLEEAHQILVDALESVEKG